ncbi:hypothetical protein [Candidatus Poriferisocius sp.]|uniref:hypothetical protein n=1 Tax=Candidatus Poriferisocius sp. TaxID=3101276 RepID=UPI003B022E66
MAPAAGGAVLGRAASAAGGAMPAGIWSDGEVVVTKVAWYRGMSETVTRTDHADYERIVFYAPNWSIPQAHYGESYTPTEDDVGKYLMVNVYYWDRLNGGTILHDVQAVRTPGQVVAAS